jgi:hypothetical protein
MSRFLAFLCLNLTITSTFAQNTLSSDAPAPKATLQDVSWIAGHWRGEAFGGQIEEIWSPALGGSMMGSFKMVMKGEVNFYELMHIQEIEGTLLLQIRHFNQDFTGWETQNESEDFKLVKISKDHIYFDGLTFERVSANEMNIYVLTSEAAETPTEAKFSYKRFRMP